MKKFTTKQFYRHSGFALVIFSVLSFATIAQDFPKSGDFAKGAQTWADNCSRCHNMRDPKDLSDEQWVTTVFHMRIRAGLTGQQTRDIITFLQQSNNKSRVAKKTSIEGSVEGSVEPKSNGATLTGLSGEKVYTQTCIACHGADGKGMVPGAPNFTASKSPLSKSDAQLMKNITQGFQTPGSPMAMPAKGGNAALTAQDIENVLKYIRDKFSQ